MSRKQSEAKNQGPATKRKERRDDLRLFHLTLVRLFFACSSTWTPQGVYLESNRDECTVSLVYVVHLEKQGSVAFTYQYPDNNIFFEFYVRKP